MSAELVVATPLLLLLVMAVVQFALWQHAEHVATAAAQEGVRAVRLQGGTAAGGEARAGDYLTQLAAHIIADPVVTAQRDARTARVEITGTAQSVIPFLRLPVHAVSVSPVETFRAVPTQGAGP